MGCGTSLEPDVVLLRGCGKDDEPFVRGADITRSAVAPGGSPAHPVSKDDEERHEGG
jgi:hypothetical protein